MNYLVDTQLIVWTTFKSKNLSAAAIDRLSAATACAFSVASLWEIAIKFALGRPDFQIDPRVLRRGMLDAGYVEVPVTADHALAVLVLPPIHKDPFDRLLIAQATVEGLTLLTVDKLVARYPGPIQLV